MSRPKMALIQATTGSAVRKLAVRCTGWSVTAWRVRRKVAMSARRKR